MCAIAGIWHPNQSNPTIVEKMTQRLSHRGPDAEGFWHDQYCSLGHRRLKIVDLSDSANQPMISSNGDWVMVFNGEIYNHSELARSFLKHHTFRTSSDTEVLLEGFATYGIDFVQHLKGMFALALYHLSTHTLWLLRDASGIKPLMYSFWEGGVAFGSEIKALLEVPRLNHSINNLALEQYLQLGYIPSPLTVYKAINKLSKGEVLRINHQGHELYNWQKKDNSEISNQTPQDFLSSKEKLKETIKTAVKRQLMADVPVGVFLSGGIDSTTIATIAADVSHQPLKTFSIGTGKYEESELPTAKNTAKAIGAQHTEYLIQPEDIKHWLTRLQSVYDEPYADSSGIPTLLISNLCVHKVKVALSGDGADELFMGYGIYQWAARRMNPITFAAGRVLKYFPFAFKQSKYQKLIKMMQTNSTLDPAHIFTVENGFFTLDEARQLLQSEQNESFTYSIFKPDFRRYEENQALFDRAYYLPDDLLKKVDRASMYSGLEVRVPYLDEDLIEFAASIPYEFKVCNGHRKFILKEVLKDYFPSYDFMKPKRGFSIPLSTWLLSDLSYLIDEWLSPSLIEEYQLVNANMVKKIVSDFRGGASTLFSKVWLLIVLHQFMHKYRTSNSL